MLLPQCWSTGIFQDGQATEFVSQFASVLYDPPLRNERLFSGKNADFISNCCIEIGLVTAVAGHDRDFANIFH